MREGDVRGNLAKNDSRSGKCKRGVDERILEKSFHMLYNASGVWYNTYISGFNDSVRDAEKS